MNKEFQIGDLVGLQNEDLNWGSFQKKQFGIVLGWRRFPDGEHYLTIFWNDGEKTNTHPASLVKL